MSNPSASANRFPLPDTDWELTREFFAAAARSELRIPRCLRCQRFVWFPEAECPRCSSGEIVWHQVSGRGSLYSWAVVRRPLYKAFSEMVPYVSALVSLEEDPEVRLVSRIVDCDPETLQGDQPLRVVFRPLRFPERDGEVVVPYFTPVAEGD